MMTMFFHWVLGVVLGVVDCEMLDCEGPERPEMDDMVVEIERSDGGGSCG